MAFLFAHDSLLFIMFCKTALFHDTPIRILGCPQFHCISGPYPPYTHQFCWLMISFLLKVTIWWVNHLAAKVTFAILWLRCQWVTLTTWKVWVALSWKIGSGWRPCWWRWIVPCLQGIRQSACSIRLHEDMKKIQQSDLQLYITLPYRTIPIIKIVNSDQVRHVFIPLVHCRRLCHRRLHAAAPTRWFHNVGCPAASQFFKHAMLSECADALA